MNNEAKFIFDMDGTLYRFDEGRVVNFSKSRFYSDLKEKVYRYFSSKLGLSNQQAQAEYERINDKYAGEVSIGVEKEYDIDRYEFFCQYLEF